MERFVKLLFDYINLFLLLALPGIVDMLHWRWQPSYSQVDGVCIQNSSNNNSDGRHSSLPWLLLMHLEIILNDHDCLLLLRRTWYYCSIYGTAWWTSRSSCLWDLTSRAEPTGTKSSADSQKVLPPSIFCTSITVLYQKRLLLLLLREPFIILYWLRNTRKRVMFGRFSLSFTWDRNGEWRVAARGHRRYLIQQ